MLKIKFKGSHFSGELNFSGVVEEFLKEIPTEGKEILVKDTEELLIAYCSAISGSILVPSVFSSFRKTVSRALQDAIKITMKEMKEHEVHSSSPRDMVPNGTLIEN